jgi:hypothetical protein
VSVQSRSSALSSPLVRSIWGWFLFGLSTLIVAAPQLPIYFGKAFGGSKVRRESFVDR